MENLHSLISKEIFIEKHTNKKADIIFIPGNTYKDMAVLASELYKSNLSDLIMPSGYKSITSSSCNIDGFDTEWDFLRDILVSSKVRNDCILKENKAQFTMENAIYSRYVLDDMDININSAILCVNSYHSKRALLYYKRAFPNVNFSVYCANPDKVYKESWYKSGYGINKVLGEVDRLLKQKVFIDDMNLWNLFKDNKVNKEKVLLAREKQKIFLDIMYS